MVSRTIAEIREPMVMALRRFDDNVTELLAITSEYKIEMEEHKHRPISDFIKLKTTRSRWELPRVLTLLRNEGFTEHFTITEERFRTMDMGGLRLCCDGTREFVDEWTTFHCRWDALVVFAFKNPKDAILVRMHA